MPTKVKQLATIGFVLGCVLQFIALLRYIRRFPDDWLGMSIYALTLMIFVAAAIITYVRWETIGK